MPPKYPETPYVRDDKNYVENYMTKELHPTDGNMMGFEQMYGGGKPDMSQVQAAPVGQTVEKFMQLYGQDQAIQVLDELIRMQEANGGSLSQRAPGTLSEMESYGLARHHPTDGNLMGHEQRFGYPPSVGPNPPQAQTPFRQAPVQQGPMNAFALEGRK